MEGDVHCFFKKVLVNSLYSVLISELVSISLPRLVQQDARAKIWSCTSFCFLFLVLLCYLHIEVNNKIYCEASWIWGEQEVIGGKSQLFLDLHDIKLLVCCQAIKQHQTHIYKSITILLCTVFPSKACNKAITANIYMVIKQPA